MRRASMLSVRIEKGLNVEGYGLRWVSTMRVRVEKGLKDEG